MKSPSVRWIRSAVWALLAAVGLGVLVYEIVFVFRSGTSDYYDHLIWAVHLSGQDILNSFFDGRDRLWHICVRLAVALGVTNIWQAGALVTAVADTAAYLLVYRCWDKLLPEGKPPRWLLALIVLCVFLVSSLTLPGRSFYTGRGAVNTWHNPTNIMVRPFAAAVFAMTADIYDRRRKGQDRLVFDGGFWAQFEKPVFTHAQVVLYPLCLLFSVYAKPSFLQIFAPAILLFLLIDLVRSRGMLFPFCLKMALAFLPAGLVVLRQYNNFFGGGLSLAVNVFAAGSVPAASVASGAGIRVYYLDGTFLQTTLRWARSALLPCAFPLAVGLMAPRRAWRDTRFRLGLLCVAAGLLEAMFLHETGARSWHGNFTWGLYLGCWLLWTGAVGQYASLLGERSGAGKLARWGGSALLLWHLACGVGYISRILQTSEYYF